MKITFRILFIFIAVFLLQNLVEATTYQLLRYFSGSVKASSLVGHISRFLLFKAALSSFIYLPAALIIYAQPFLQNRVLFRVFIIHALVNPAIVALFGFYIEPTLFDKTIFGIAVMLGLVSLLLVYLWELRLKTNQSNRTG